MPRRSSSSSRGAHAAMAAGCGEAAEMMARAAAMVLVGAVAGLGRLGGGSGRCLGPPWSAVFERPWASSSDPGRLPAALAADLSKLDLN